MAFSLYQLQRGVESVITLDLDCSVENLHLKQMNLTEVSGKLVHCWARIPRIIFYA